jgi:hypothetical protein
VNFVYTPILLVCIVGIRRDDSSGRAVLMTNPAPVRSLYDNSLLVTKILMTPTWDAGT